MTGGNPSNAMNDMNSIFNTILHDDEDKETFLFLQILTNTRQSRKGHAGGTKELTGINTCRCSVTLANGFQSRFHMTERSFDILVELLSRNVSIYPV